MTAVKQGVIFREGGCKVQDKVRINARVAKEVAQALQKAYLAAGGYSHKSRLVEEALRAHSEARKYLAAGVEVVSRSEGSR